MTSLFPNHRNSEIKEPRTVQVTVEFVKIGEIDT
jgi:hypothetical protein